MMRVQLVALTCMVLGFESVSGHTVQSRPIVANSAPLDVVSHFNNKGFATYPSEAAFDPLGQSYPAFPVGSNGSYTSTQTGIVYRFPGYSGPSEPDNILCEGQIISVPNDVYFSASMLVSSDVELETVSGNVTYVYSDNSTSLSELRSLPWFAFLTINRGEIVFPYRYTANGTNFNTSHIFEYTSSLDAGKTLTSIILPDTTNTTTGRLHIFSISLWKGSSVQVQSVRPTQKWTGNGTQVVEVTINNFGSECVAGPGLNVSISGTGVKTEIPGFIKRLCPGDQKRVNLAVTGKANTSLTITLDDSVEQQTQLLSNVEIGLSEYTPDSRSLSLHESPDWFDDAKFGIMIHWGPYSVTGWGNSSPYESYAEWFWWYSTHHPEADASDFYDYRLRTFGPDWVYDDTFPDFTAANFSPKAWVDLFADAGARYFVVTTKHHDGFANFDTGNSTHRNALHYGPKRDLLGDLFKAAREYQPLLKRGTYFSLPEWFNPDFGPYGFAQLDSPSSTTWPGIIARNPYTNRTEPYTGRLPINDFIADLMVPQMETLAYRYETDIMWCDCGAANGTADFAARWWNEARATSNRQVAINSRCGIPYAADFDTPEYTTFSSAQRRKWESNSGMDPYSYGYNRATPTTAFMNASTIIASLVDIVSKNGNFLLDIGPMADGTILDVEEKNLREAGKWIRRHEEAVFNITYWFIQTEVENEGIRFTQTVDASYILFLVRPVLVRDVGGNATSVVIPAPVPILAGDVVTALGVGVDTTADPVVEWNMEDQGLRIYVDEKVLAGEEYCWVFKIAYT